MILVRIVIVSFICKLCRFSVDLVLRYWFLYRLNNYDKLGLFDLDYCIIIVSKLCVI